MWIWVRKQKKRVKMQLLELEVENVPSFREFLQEEIYLLNVVLISRRNGVTSNARIRTRQVNGEASSGCHCLVDGAALRVRCSESSLVVCCGRIRFTVDRCSWRNVTLCIEIFPIWVWLSDECRWSTCRTWVRENRFFLIDLKIHIWRGYLRHSCCCVILSIIMTWRWCVVIQTSTWTRCRACLMGTLNIA